MLTLAGVRHFPTEMPAPFDELKRIHLHRKIELVVAPLCAASMNDTRVERALGGAPKRKSSDRIKARVTSDPPKTKRGERR